MSESEHERYLEREQAARERDDIRAKLRALVESSDKVEATRWHGATTFFATEAEEEAAIDEYTAALAVYEAALCAARGVL